MEYVTDTGLKKKTLQELRTETENGLKQVFGVGFETAVDSPNPLGPRAGSLFFARPEPGDRHRARCKGIL